MSNEAIQEAIKIATKESKPVVIGSGAIGTNYCPNCESLARKTYKNVEVVVWELQEIEK